jgi:hypothetical protein
MATATVIDFRAARQARLGDELARLVWFLLAARPRVRRPG